MVSPSQSDASTAVRAETGFQRMGAKMCPNENPRKSSRILKRPVFRLVGRLRIFSEIARYRFDQFRFCEDLFGRDAGIRTRDPLNPIQVRYQTAPRPDLIPAFEQLAAALSNWRARIPPCASVWYRSLISPLPTGSIARIGTRRRTAGCSTSATTP